MSPVSPASRRSAGLPPLPRSRRAPIVPPLPPSCRRWAHGALSISLAVRIKRKEKVPRKRYVEVNPPRKCHVGQNRLRNR
uniref:Uncharacterized protein n=1 Tax=Oryza barthii TaxID=65489 RepID=A0A0D3H4Z9_9ORYZ